MARYTHKGVEYFVNGPGKGGKFSWFTHVGGTKYAGEASNQSNAADAAKSIINRKK